MRRNRPLQTAPQVRAARQPESSLPVHLVIANRRVFHAAYEPIVRSFDFSPPPPYTGLFPPGAMPAARPFDPLPRPARSGGGRYSRRMPAGGSHPGAAFGDLVHVARHEGTGRDPNPRRPSSLATQTPERRRHELHRAGLPGRDGQRQQTAGGSKTLAANRSAHRPAQAGGGPVICPPGRLDLPPRDGEGTFSTRTAAGQRTDGEPLPARTHGCKSSRTTHAPGAACWDRALRIAFRQRFQQQRLPANACPSSSGGRPTQLRPV